ncbi:MAG: ABC transporter permease [Theionarchaea archaeon]|nr:ABC transporter permease [Theionarchaea archaeon]
MNAIVYKNRIDILRTIKAELFKEFRHSFFTNFMLFFNLVLPFGLGITYYFIYLPFDHDIINVQGFKMPLLDFTLAGQVIYLLFVNMILIGSYFSEERLQGTLEVIFLTPCNRLALLLGGSIAGLINYFWFALGLTLVVFILDIELRIRSLPAVILSISLAICSTIIIGMLFQILFVSSRRGGLWATVLQEPVIFVSGIVFPLQYAPRLIQLLGAAIPLSYSVLAFRASVFSGATVSQLSSIFIPLAALSLFYLIVTAYAVQLVDTRLRKEGTIQLY